MKTEDQVVVLYALTKGFLDNIAVDQIKSFEEGLIEYAQRNAKTFYKEVNETRMWTDAGEIELKKVIDEIEAASGGEKFRVARELRARKAKYFENASYVSDLLSKKPGTTDRKVALDDIFKHSILDGSLEDTRAIGVVLKKGGPEAQQARHQCRQEQRAGNLAAVERRDGRSGPTVPRRRVGPHVGGQRRHATGQSTQEI